jgi:hypothetical protein
MADLLLNRYNKYNKGGLILLLSGAAANLPSEGSPLCITCLGSRN